MYRGVFSFHVVISPSTTNYSFESDSIAIYWKRDDAVESYKIQYNFTMRECANEVNTHVTNNKLNKIQIMERNNYTIHNSTDLPVEEDSDYQISLIAVISNVSSPAAVIMGTTKEAGMHTCTIMLI